MALKPVQDRVIVKYFETEDKTASGIVLPDSSREKTQQAEVIAVGGGKELRLNMKVRNIW